MSQYAPVVLFAALAVAGCSKQKEPGPGMPAPVAAPEAAQAPAPAPTPAPVVTAPVAPPAPVLWKEGEPVDPVVLEKLAIAIGSCTIADYEISKECPPRAAFDKAHGQLAMINAQEADLVWAPRLLDHPTPVVRVFAASYLGSLFGTSAAAADVLAGGIAREQVTEAVARMLRFASPGAQARSDKLRTAVAAIATSHADAGVRRHAVMTMGSRDIPGAGVVLARVIDADRDPGVRGEACKALGKIGDDAAIPVLARRTAQPAADVALYGACMEGLVAMWADYPFHRNASKKAFELTLARLADRPRVESRVPPFSVIGTLAYLGDDGAAEWKARATWWKPDRLRKVLGEIIVDKAAGYATHSAALGTAIKLGATRSELEAWRKKVAGPPLSEALDQAIAAAH